MDWARVHADSELREAENIFYLEDIREISDMALPTKQLSTVQTPDPDVETSK